MRTYDKKIGEKILKIVYENEPDGIGFNKITRVTGYPKKTINRWLDRLRDLKILKNLPKYPIHLTKKSIQQYEQNISIIPEDRRKKKNILFSKNNKLTKKEIRKQKILFIILMKAIFGSELFFRTQNPMLGDIGIFDPIDKKTSIAYTSKKKYGVGIDDLIYRLPILNAEEPNKEAFMPENRFNIENNDIFGYLKISKEEAQESIQLMLNHNPPILKSIERENNIVNSSGSYLNIEYNNVEEYDKRQLKLESDNIQTARKQYNGERYEIANELLKEFISNFILLFNAEIEFLIECEYIIGNIKNNMLSNNQKPINGIKIYRKWLKDLYGTSNKFGETFFIQNEKKKKLKNNNERKGYQTRIDDHYKVIYSNSILDNNLNIQSKYKTLETIYSDVWNALHLLLPHDIKKMINYLYATHQTKLFN